MRSAECGMDAVLRCRIPATVSLWLLHEPLACHVINEYHCPLPTFQKHFVVSPRDRFPPPLVIDPPRLPGSLDRHRSDPRWRSTCIELYLHPLWDIESSKSVS